MSVQQQKYCTVIPDQCFIVTSHVGMQAFHLGPNSWTSSLAGFAWILVQLLTGHSVYVCTVESHRVTKRFTFVWNIVSALRQDLERLLLYSKEIFSVFLQTVIHLLILDDFNEASNILGTLRITTELNTILLRKKQGIFGPN